MNHDFNKLKVDALTQEIRETSARLSALYSEREYVFRDPAKSLVENMQAYIAIYAPVNPRDLVDFFRHAEESVVRRGIWEMRDSRLVSFDVQWRLVPHDGVEFEAY